MQKRHKEATEEGLLSSPPQSNLWDKCLSMGQMGFLNSAVTRGKYGRSGGI